MGRYIKYKKDAIEAAVKNNYSMAGVLTELGLKLSGGNYTHMKSRIERFEIDNSHFKGQGWSKGHKAMHRKTPEEVFLLRTSGGRTNGKILKRCLIKTGHAEECANCGQGTTWNGNALVLQVNHIDGNWLDNRRENLELLCPNCHTQTSTFGSRNIK